MIGAGDGVRRAGLAHQLGAPVAAHIVEGAHLVVLPAHQHDGGAAHIHRLDGAGPVQLRIGHHEHPRALEDALVLQRQPLLRPIGCIGQARGLIYGRERLGVTVFAKQLPDLFSDGGVWRVHEQALELCSVFR